MILDHVFIITQPGAPEAQHLIELGITEGSSNTHPGQGTSNRRFFLDNLKIELLFITDAEEAANGAGHRLGILKRFNAPDASPFGIVVRVDDPANKPEFPSWQYYPDYFTEDMCFYVGDNSDELTEPLCICMPPALPIPAQQENGNPGWQLTELIIDVPRADLSSVARVFNSIDNVTIKPGQVHGMVLKFNDGISGKAQDLMPDLPVKLMC